MTKGIISENVFVLPNIFQLVQKDSIHDTKVPMGTYHIYYVL